jgi:hypothetical protein
MGTEMSCVCSSRFPRTDESGGIVVTKVDGASATVFWIKEKGSCDCLDFFEI